MHIACYVGPSQRSSSSSNVSPMNEESLFYKSKHFATIAEDSKSSQNYFLSQSALILSGHLIFIEFFLHSNSFGNPAVYLVKGDLSLFLCLSHSAALIGLSPTLSRISLAERSFVAPCKKNGLPNPK
jgi:hypothetical protein